MMNTRLTFDLVLWAISHLLAPWIAFDLGSILDLDLDSDFGWVLALVNVFSMVGRLR